MSLKEFKKALENYNYETAADILVEKNHSKFAVKLYQWAYDRAYEDARFAEECTMRYEDIESLSRSWWYDMVQYDKEADRIKNKIQGISF